jgi:hypothetical protein
MLAMARAGKGNPASEPKATPKPAAKQPSAKKTATAKPVEVDGAKKKRTARYGEYFGCCKGGSKAWSSEQGGSTSPDKASRKARSKKSHQSAVSASSTSTCSPKTRESQ